MTTEAPSAASIADRLVRLSKERRLDHSFVLVRYGIERLLWRISSSAFADDFVLKGANLFAVWWEDDRRPTRDLDLLGQGTPDPARLAGIFRALCAQDTSLRDGLVFDPATVVAERIRAEEEYEGVRVRLRATLLRTRIDVQVDIGFGDAVTPLPERKPFPTLLGGVAPVLRVYPLETAFAEKLQALVELGVRNSRLKDYHDMLAILESKSTGDDRKSANLGFSYLQLEGGLFVPDHLASHLFRDAPAADRLPLYEAKMIHQFVTGPRRFA